MNPAFSKAAFVKDSISKDANIFTDIELSMYGINSEELHKMSCLIFKQLKDEHKEKLKNTFVSKSKSGFYEYVSKDIECTQDELER